MRVTQARRYTFLLGAALACAGTAAAETPCEYNQDLGYKSDTRCDSILDPRLKERCLTNQQEYYLRLASLADSAHAECLKSNEQARQRKHGLITVALLLASGFLVLSVVLTLVWGLGREENLAIQAHKALLNEIQTAVSKGEAGVAEWHHLNERLSQANHVLGRLWPRPSAAAANKAAALSVVGAFFLLVAAVAAWFGTYGV